jgi:hypothetical protein
MSMDISMPANWKVDNLSVCNFGVDNFKSVVPVVHKVHGSWFIIIVWFHMCFAIHKRQWTFFIMKVVFLYAEQFFAN